MHLPALVVRHRPGALQSAHSAGDALAHNSHTHSLPQVSILPFDVMGLVMDSDAVAQFRLLRVVRLLRLLKLARILRASRIFRRWENEVNLSYSVMSLIKFMVGVTTIAHWVRAAECVCCSVACEVCVTCVVAASDGLHVAHRGGH